MSEITVGLDGLRGAAQEVESVARDSRAAAQAAAAGQTMSEDAFGILCVAMVPPSQMAQTSAVSALNVIAEAIGVTARSADACASDYGASDQGLASNLGRLGGRLT